MSAQPSDEEFRRDNDSLYVMPLAIVPFTTPSLRRGRLVKNTMLKPAIEVYRANDGTSGQILIEDVTPEFGHNYFGWDLDEMHPDLAMLYKLAQLTSYDVYSLRILFRRMGFPVETMKYLILSEQKKEQLGKHMKKFTQPLVKHIYGESKSDGAHANDIIGLFSAPDTEQALVKLQALADVLDMPIDAIPAFLEDFADIYLSFSYYQECLDSIVPLMLDMVTEINELKKSWQMKQDVNLMRASQELVNDLSDLTASTAGRFESFDRNTEKMWENISAESFRSTETMIRSYHTTIGGVLCGLGIKMNAWKTRFPSSDVGGPQARAELILSSMRPGMEIIKAIDQAAAPLNDSESPRKKQPSSPPTKGTHSTVPPARTV